MKRFTLGTPEDLVPSKFCPGFRYEETPVSYPASNFVCRETPAGFVVEFPLEDDCQIFGFGLQLRQFNHRGRSLKLAVNADPVTANGESHAPVPFFVTNKGWGMYFDTARYAEFDCGRQKNPVLGGKRAVSEGGAADNEADLYAARRENAAYMTVRIPAARGVDVYVIEGRTISDIVAQYNLLAGGGPEVPDWGLGMLYRCYTGWDAEKIKSVADYFRENDIPCDIIGLEPGWQTHAYSCTYKWSSRYPDPDGFLSYLRERGYHVNLWEHAFTHPDADFFGEIAPYSGDWMVWGGLVPDFATPEARKIFADYTRTHLVERGIDGFKLDECDSSDNTGGWSFPLTSRFPSGLDGEQYHSLFGTLYIQTLLDALGERKTLSEVRNIGALAASYPFVLYSDLYDHRDFIRGVVNSGFSGILWAPEFRSAHSKEECVRRMQAVVFSVQCLVNAWNYDGIPWVVHECEDEVKELLRIRAGLIPMLKAAFEKYHETGIPPIRALVMDYTDDAATYGIDNEYLFCEDLLVAPIAAGTGDERDVYLPVSDEWEDYFTGERVGNGKIHVKTDGIPVYRRVRK
ncbi:MAG: glycoside hydrolase [Clostridia bacterium]|nr:glycoside hydrolase [Clostridia bacterium]